MSDILSIIPICIYVVSGIICLSMAYKCFFVKKFLPFHEEASGTKWDNIDKRLQEVILTILRISGLGFLVVAILLIVFPLINYSKQDAFIDLSVPAIAMIFSSGLFVLNYRLYKITYAKTPWNGALGITILLALALFLSLI